MAGELCRRGYAAVVTLGNTPNTDVLCSNREGTRFAHIQVKTFVAGRDKTCTVGLKAQNQFGEAFFWILAGIPAPTSSAPFEYFIVPCKHMAENVVAYHQRWLGELGRAGQQRNDSSVRVVSVIQGRAPHTWNVEAFRNRWDLIEAVLQSSAVRDRSEPS